MTTRDAAAQKISIIIPCFNAARFFAPCLSSVMEQTHKNIEIIIVDSGSTDGSIEIAKAASERDPRVHLHMLINSDVSASRNYGVSLATGDWIGFSDSDDIVKPECYETLLKAALDNGVAMAMGAYDECHLDTPPRFVRPVGARACTLRSAAEIQRYFLTDGKYLTHMWTKLFRRDVFDGVEFPVGRIYEDMAVMPRLIDNAGSLAVVNHRVYRYLVHNNSLSTSINFRKQLTGLDVRRDYAAYIAEHYPELTPYAKDAILSIGANILGKLWHVGPEKEPEAWETTVQQMREALPGAALQDVTYRFLAYTLKKDPRFLARAIHLLLRLDRML